MLCLLRTLHRYSQVMVLRRYVLMMTTSASSRSSMCAIHLERLLEISKRGDTYLRTLLIHGGRSVLLRLKRHAD
jgi:hypothetical protein